MSFSKWDVLFKVARSVKEPQSSEGRREGLWVLLPLFQSRNCPAAFGPPGFFWRALQRTAAWGSMSTCRSFITFDLRGLFRGRPSPTIAHFSIQRPADRRVGVKQRQVCRGRMKASFLGSLTVAPLQATEAWWRLFSLMTPLWHKGHCMTHAERQVRGQDLSNMKAWE